jgi:hypothetical protein
MVFEKMALKRLLGLKGEEVFRILHNDEPYGLGAIWVIKSRTIR